MILTLRIEKLEPGLYAAVVSDGRDELSTFEVGSIGAAIRQCVSGPLPEVTAFHIWFEHVSIGTTMLANMRHDPETLAQRLMLLHGQAR